MSAWDRLAKVHPSPNVEVPLRRVGLAILGDGLFASRYKNLMHVGPSAAGLVLQIRAFWPLSYLFPTKTLVIPWSLVQRSTRSTGPSFVPQEQWLLGAEQIPLTLPRGSIQPPV